MTTTQHEITTTYVERVSGPFLIQIIQGNAIRFIIQASATPPASDADFFVFDKEDGDRFFPYTGTERIFFRKENRDEKIEMILAFAPII